MTIPVSAGRRWRARPNDAWLICRPSSGRTRDKAQTVVMHCDAGKLDARLHRAVVTFRTDEGLNLSVTVEAEVRHETPFVRFFEAEDAQITGGFKAAADPSASGGRFVHTPSRGATGAMAFPFVAPRAGSYYVLARVFTPADEHDGFFYSMDGAKPRRWIPYARGIKFWRWQLLKPHNFKGSRSEKRGFQLPRGKHTFVLNSRGYGARLDCLTISNQPYPADPAR